MEQFEQLLTCCVCLDRYRNPKLLPCQHSFCMEPCMEGLTDYVRKQVKCPECRAEHRVPYQGIQAFPTNVTLVRFLELHIDITGELPDPTAGQIMERCGVCSEKQYLSPCAHCEKKICEDCKSAHMDILRREISRINSQIKRSLHRLQDALSIIEKNTGNLQANCFSVTEELDEINRRVAKTIKDRTDELRSQVELYLTSELRKLKTLKSNLELEIGNIVSNCDLGEKHMNDNVDWDDCELMDTKEIFLKTVEFVRNFEYESSESSKRIRFFMNKDPNQLVKDIALLGELNFPQTVSQSSTHLAPPSMQAGLSRSKSDHRLTQFRSNDDRGYDDEPVLGGRKFGERPVKNTTNSDYDTGSSRYGRSGRGGDDYDYDEPTTRTKRNFRSRFVKSHQNDDISDNEHPRSGRSGNAGQDSFKNGERVIDTEDVSRGQLSGIIRLADCSRVIKRLQDSGKGKKEKKAEKTATVAPTPTPTTAPQPAARPKQPTQAARQVSQEDEISRIKKQNKETTSAGPATVTQAETERPTSDRVTALRQQQRPATQSTSEESDSSTPNITQTSVQAAHKSPQVEADSDSEETDSDDDTSPTQQSKPPQVPGTVAGPAATNSAAASKAKVTRTTSTESSESTESSSSNVVSPTTASTAAATSRATAANTAANANTNRYNNTQNSTTKTGTSSSTPAPGEKKPFQSRFLPNHNSATANSSKKPDTESSSETETSTDEESEEEVESTTSSKKPTSSTTTSGTAASRSGSTTQNSIGNRNNTTTAPADSTSSSRRSSRDDTNARASAYSASSYTPRTRTVPAPHHDPEPDRYSTAGSSYTSRFLNRSKSSAVIQPLNTSLDDDATGDDSDTRYGTGRSRYLAMKERRSRLARSRSSHALGGDDDDLDDPPVSPTTASPSAYLASREKNLIKWPKNVHPDNYIPNIKKNGYGPSSYATENSALSRSRSSHALKSRESSPVTTGDRGAAGGSAKDGEALSSWARYLKNKYGNRRESTRDNLASSTSQSSHATPSSISSASRRLSLGLPLRQANEYGSSDDDGSKNGLGSPTSPTVAAGITGLAGISPKTLYLRKRQQLFQLGGRGSEPGSFTWPRGIAVGPDNSIVVADSSNHRVQVFDSNGIFVKEFGEYGNGEGEFDCLAGVAVNRIGQYIIADRYNHRIQVLDPQGRFLRAFGSQGTADGKFSYPWGVTTDSLGFIYVCDKENHRVQVFQSDGTFVGKFGTSGREEGQLEHPHYIAVSNTNRVIVSDSNNHRIQIFDVNGKVLSTFGGEGSEEGQFKFPRGVAVDDQGYICVADSGNNRIQIFNPDGSFLRAFGSWGSGDCEFKGLEGVAIMSNGNVLVCDRENHRVQVF